MGLNGTKRGEDQARGPQRSGHTLVCSPDKLCDVEQLPSLPVPPFAHLKTGAVNGDVTS